MELKHLLRGTETSNRTRLRAHTSLRARQFHLYTRATTQSCVYSQTTETGVENLYFAQPWPNDKSSLNRT